MLSMYRLSDRPGAGRIGRDRACVLSTMGLLVIALLVRLARAARRGSGRHPQHQQGAQPGSTVNQNSRQMDTDFANGSDLNQLDSVRPAATSGSDWT
jgi:hypothetical protein